VLIPRVKGLENPSRHVLHFLCIWGPGSVTTFEPPNVVFLSPPTCHSMEIFGVTISLTQPCNVWPLHPHNFLCIKQFVDLFFTIRPSLFQALHSPRDPFHPLSFLALSSWFLFFSISLGTFLKWVVFQIGLSILRFVVCSAERSREVVWSGWNNMSQTILWKYCRPCRWRDHVLESHFNVVFAFFSSYYRRSMVCQ
jgi:hypothetical protein